MELITVSELKMIDSCKAAALYAAVIAGTERYPDSDLLASTEHHFY